MKRKAAYAVPVLLGILFCFYYIFQAADNVAYTDYIRLINSYLPDVGNPAKFFVPDLFTRVPITYLGRIINVAWFDYNTMFDMALGVLSLGLGGAVLAVYSEKRIGFFWFLMIQLVYFGLNKWEMLTNGTGWVCFLAVSCYLLHFAVLDRAVQTHCREKGSRMLLLSLAPVLTLFVSGTYCGSYSAILLLALGTLICTGKSCGRDKKEQKTYVLAFFIVLAALLLYLWSSSQAVYEHRGAEAEGSIVSNFFQNPLFFVVFLIKAFASAVLGVEQITGLGQRGDFFGTDWFVVLLGLAVIFFYLYSLWLNVRFRLYQTTIFPLLLILSGGLNHLLVLAARWIFLNDSYGMSSRYGVQYQLGIVGILLTFALVWKEQRKRMITRLCLFSGTVMIVFCSLWTTRKELQTAPYRKEYLQISREVGLHYKTASDEELETYLHSSADKVRAAMKILEDNKLNLFSER